MKWDFPVGIPLIVAIWGLTAAIGPDSNWRRAMADSVYTDPFPLAEDTTSYRPLTKEHVSVVPFDGAEILARDYL